MDGWEDYLTTDQLMCSTVTGSVEFKEAWEKMQRIGNGQWAKEWSIMSTPPCPNWFRPQYFGSVSTTVEGIDYEHLVGSSKAYEAMKERVKRSTRAAADASAREASHPPCLSNMKSNLDLIKGREVNTMDSDYTSRVKGDLRNRDTAVAEVKKTKLDIIRAITSNVADLAVIHTDDEGLMDRGDLQISLASALRSTGYDPIDLVIDDDEE